jgi:hypothetical protein
MAESRLWRGAPHDRRVVFRMKKRFLIFAAFPAALITALLIVPLSAGSGKVVPNIGGGIVDGPYAAATPDSGTCGNNWAVDLFARSFKSTPQNDGSWKVVQTFKSGRFITLGDGQSGPGPSPGACEGGPNNGSLMKEGAAGSFTGTFTITVNPGFNYQGGGGCGTLSDWPAGAGSGSTPGDCTTGQWIAAHFPGATYGTDAIVTAYSLTYKATVNNVPKTWTNADTGNSGDICSSGPSC